MNSGVSIRSHKLDGIRRWIPGREVIRLQEYDRTPRLCQCVQYQQLACDSYLYVVQKIIIIKGILTVVLDCSGSTVAWTVVVCTVWSMINAIILSDHRLPYEV